MNNLCQGIILQWGNTCIWGCAILVTLLHYTHVVVFSHIWTFIELKNFRIRSVSQLVQIIIVQYCQFFLYFGTTFSHHNLSYTIRTLLYVIKWAHMKNSHFKLCLIQTKSNGGVTSVHSRPEYKSCPTNCSM
jgi:hypothetical protein